MNIELLKDGGDPMGAAIYDFYKNGKAGVLRVCSSEFDDDEIPVCDLFRSYHSSRKDVSTEEFGFRRYSRIFHMPPAFRQWRTSHIHPPPD